MDTPTDQTAYILVIDDDEAICESIKASLEDSRPQFVVSTAPSAVAGLEAVAQQRPDVIVLDLNMPLGDGFQFTEMLRKDPANRTVKILMLTANASRANEWESIDRDIDDFLAKPFDLDELEARIVNLLAKPFGTASRI